MLVTDLVISVNCIGHTTNSDMKVLTWAGFSAQTKHVGYCQSQIPHEWASGIRAVSSKLQCLMHV